jgi:hypothetical protein
VTFRQNTEREEDYDMESSHPSENM